MDTGESARSVISCPTAGARRVLVVLLLVFLKEAGCFSRGRPQATMPRKPGSAMGRDTSTVEVSRLTEGQIMRVLKERDGAGQALEHAGTKKVGKVWDELVALGFTQELAARALERTPTVSVPDCLDWLCLNVEEDQLPRRFRSSYRAAEMADGAVTVVAPPRASQAHADAQAAEAQEDEDPVAAAAAAGHARPWYQRWWQAVKWRVTGLSQSGKQQDSADPASAVPAICGPSLSRISLVVSSSNWHWASAKGNDISEAHKAGITARLQRIASLPCELLDANSHSMSQIDDVKWEPLHSLIEVKGTARIQKEEAKDDETSVPK